MRPPAALELPSGRGAQAGPAPGRCFLVRRSWTWCEDRAPRRGLRVLAQGSVSCQGSAHEPHPCWMCGASCAFIFLALVWESCGASKERGAGTT